MVTVVSPVRIQRSRTKGWRMPEGAVYVGRPTRWGNPYAVGESIPLPGIYEPDGSGREVMLPVGPQVAVMLFEASMADVVRQHPEYLDPLRGHDLACWCPLDQPCHADVLLELANPAHKHFYPWSEVKAARMGGPEPRCIRCGKAARR